MGIKHEKIEEYLVDLFRLEDQAADFKADDVFCCIGTTKSKTPDKELYRKIDFGIPVTASKLAKKNNINTFLVMSALGANANSSIFYSKLKGEMENAVLAQKIAKTYIIQASLIGGHRTEKRPGEWLAKQWMNIFGFLLVGSLSKYKIIAPENIAKAMIWLAANAYPNIVIESDKIKKIAAKYA